MKTITAPEIAQALGVSRRAVYAMLGAGQIPHIRVGVRYIVSRAAFDRWIDSLGTVPMPSAPREAALQ